MKQLEPDFEKKICRIIAATLRLPEDSVTSKAEIGSPTEWDSLGHIAVIVNLEKDLQIQISDREAANISSVSEILDLLKIKLVKGRN